MTMKEIEDRYGALPLRTAADQLLAIDLLHQLQDIVDDFIAALGSTSTGHAYSVSRETTRFLNRLPKRANLPVLDGDGNQPPGEPGGGDDGSIA